MMNLPIFDLNPVATQEAETDDASQGFMDHVMAGLRKLPAASDVDLTEEVLERAAAYEDSQPSYAADLRAAVA